MKHTTLLLLALALFLAAGCASGGARDGADAPARTDSRTITREEIATSSASNAFELVQQVRPQWLRTRGTTTLRTRETTIVGGATVAVIDEPGIMVYVDGSRSGSTDALRHVPVTDVTEVRFLSGTEATSRFGTEHPHGAILVVTAR